MTHRFLTLTVLFFWILSVVPLAVAEEDSLTPYPDPRRFEDAIGAFETQDLADPPPPGAVLCIGSSGVRFWHDTMADDLQPLTLIGRGFGGSTMLDVLFYCSRVVVPYQPRAILIYEGDNDVDGGVSAARFMATFCSSSKWFAPPCRKPDCTSLRSSRSPARWKSWPVMKAANGELQRVCSDDPLLEYVGIRSPHAGTGRASPFRKSTSRTSCI